MPSAKNFRNELVGLLAKIDGTDLMSRFLDDLLTPGELDEFSRRWQIIKMLHAGIPQREIAERLGVGIATVTRGSRAIADDTDFVKILNKLYANP